MVTAIVLCSVSAALVLVDIILVLTLHKINGRLVKRRKTPPKEEVK
ncbi:MAG: hypothetical protein K2K60_07360 [Clostridia bacterium]|nr:hypothetical protein [Clostridia bacterium]